MEHVLGFECVDCSRHHRPGDVDYVCPNCGGNLDGIYYYERIRAAGFRRSTLERDHNLTIWRYRGLLPINPDPVPPPPTVRRTPVYRSQTPPAPFAVKRLFIQEA